MLKILALVLSFFLGRYEQSFKKSTLILIDQFIAKSRKLFMFLTALGIMALLFTSGVVISLLQMTYQFDHQGYIASNTTLMMGISLIVITSIVFMALFSSSAWASRFKKEVLVEHKEAPNKSEHHPSAFEQALTVLIQEFTKERELHRQAKANEAASRSTSTKAEPTFNASSTHNPSHGVVN